MSNETDHRNFSKLKIRTPPSSCLGAARHDKKRKAAALTVDNADIVFSECFDIDTFTKFLDQAFDARHDRDLIFSFLKASVIDSKVVPFEGTSMRHLSLLGINTIGSLEFDPDQVKALNLPDSPSNKILQQDVEMAFKKHFSPSMELNCRSVIDQFLLAAVTYAQLAIDTDRDIKDDVFARSLILKPHVAVFVDLPVPKTAVTHNGVSYIFHGLLDYGVGIIKSGDSAERVLGSGLYSLDIHKALCIVVEAKSVFDIQEGAEAQIVMQVLMVLALTGRTTFTGALSNGGFWKFYTAEKDGESGYRVYSSMLYMANSNRGLIVELLKDMILYDKSPLISTVSEEDVLPPRKLQHTA